MRIVLGLVAAAWIVSGCTSKTTNPGPGPGPKGDGDVCLEPGADPLCGTACTDDVACGANLYCGASGTCTADCRAGDTRCGGGFICGANGRCIVDPDGPFMGNGACAVTSSQASLAKKPVDIIFVIDNSGSMTLEIVGVEQNINTNFASIIAASGLDYRVIMISRHGDSGDQRICIAQPLSGNTTCSPPPAQPTNTSTFFHYSEAIGSTNSLRKILDTYNDSTPGGGGTVPGGWSSWLRADAFKTFIEVTDDNQGGATSPDQFETELFALSPTMFGTASARNYVFHSLVGVAAKANPAETYAATEPVVADKCGSAVNNGAAYQELSRRTGGLRFPVCDPNNYNAVFQAAAQGVVQSGQVACDFDIPPPPNGETLDLNKVAVAYTPSSGGATQYWRQGTAQASCMPSAFYIEANRVHLCPEGCSAVRADPMAKVDVLFTCEGTVIF